MKLKKYNNLLEDLYEWEKRFFLSRPNLSEHSKKQYKRALNKFFSFIKKYEDELQIDDINSLIFNEYISFLKEKNLSPVSIKDYLIILKSFFMFITEENEDLKDYTKAFSKIRIKIPKKRKDILYKDEIEKILKYLKNEIALKGDYKAYRNSLLFKIALFTGMRVSSLVKLKFENIKETEHNGNKIYAINFIQKGEKENTAYIKKELIEYELNKLFQKALFKKDAYILRGDKPLTRQQVFNILKEIYKKAGINKSGVHILRHTFVYLKREQGVDLSTIQAMLGHSSITTTINIYGKATEEQKIEASLKI